MRRPIHAQMPRRDTLRIPRGFASVLYSTVQYRVLYNIQYCTVPGYSTVQSSTVLYSTVLYPVRVLYCTGAGYEYSTVRYTRLDLEDSYSTVVLL